MQKKGNILTIGDSFNKLWYIYMWECYAAIKNYIFKEHLRLYKVFF